MHFPLDHTVSRTPLSALLDGNQHLRVCLSAHPMLPTLLLALVFSKELASTLQGHHLTPVLPSAPKPCQLPRSAITFLSDTFSPLP